VGVRLALTTNTYHLGPDTGRSGRQTRGVRSDERLFPRVPAYFGSWDHSDLGRCPQISCTAELNRIRSRRLRCAQQHSCRAAAWRPTRHGAPGSSPLSAYRTDISQVWELKGFAPLPGYQCPGRSHRVKGASGVLWPSLRNLSIPQSDDDYAPRETEPT
jgi:hypothetical protein